MHIAQLMPLPLAISCFSKIQIGFTFLVPAHLGSPGQSAVERVCVKRISYLPITGYDASNRLSKYTAATLPPAAWHESSPGHIKGGDETSHNLF